MKDIIVDTNVLLENPDTIEILMDKKENDERNRIYIPEQVIEELDILKNNNARLRPVVMKTIESLNKHKDDLIIIRNGGKYDSRDNNIIKELEENKHKLKDAIFVTNDKLLQFKIKSTLGMEVEEFKESKPFESESEVWTGFADNEEEIDTPNTFFFNKGKLHFSDSIKTFPLTVEYKPWNISPKTVYQNAAMHLMLNDEIPLVSLQSSAGFGKTIISLACALEKVLKEKKYNKIYIFKNIVEVGGNSMGFLPGDLKEKMEPHVKYIHMLLQKLRKARNGNNKVFLPNGMINDDVIEILPLNFIRGMNIENAFVIAEECQNMSRFDVRGLLSRMCENVKCVCNGDTNQIDSQHLDKQNNGLNWICKTMKGHKGYAHLVMKGSKSRGPITDMVLERNL